MPVPPGYYYASHIARMEAFNELAGLQFSKKFIMHRLDWSTESMVRTYQNGRITHSHNSEWFLAHLSAGASPA